MSRAELCVDLPVTSTCVHTPTRRDSGTSVLKNPLDFAVLSPQQGLPPSSSSLPAATAASQRIREEVRMLGRNLDSASFMAHGVYAVCCSSRGLTLCRGYRQYTVKSWKAHPRKECWQGKLFTQKLTSRLVVGTFHAI